MTWEDEQRLAKLQSRVYGGFLIAPRVATRAHSTYMRAGYSLGGLLSTSCIIKYTQLTLSDRAGVKGSTDRERAQRALVV